MVREKVGGQSKARRLKMQELGKEERREEIEGGRKEVVVGSE